MSKKSPKPEDQTRKVVSVYFSNGIIIETIYDANSKQTALAYLKDGQITISAFYKMPEEGRLEAIPATNNLIKHGAVIFAEKPVAYESVGKLIIDIQLHIYRYVDVSDHFRKIASYYILLTWVYDAFNEVPYLRLRGDFGSGKTRALFVIGSLCNKAFFASGASTVSPIFHTLDTFRGTLIFDEADFRFSDEKNELVKIFNNGNVRGFPILRTAITTQREFDPRAFNVYGPKIVAMRKSFEDPALESRFLTEEMGQSSLRKDIPINLPDIQKVEAVALRNQLLMYRFTKLPTVKINESLIDPSLSPRLNQILIPLLSIIDDENLRQEIRATVRSFDQKLYAERSSSIEAGVLEVLRDLFQQNTSGSIPVSQVAAIVIDRFSGDYSRPITVRTVGGVLRKRLHLITYKSHGIYVLPVTEKPKVDELCIRYGVVERSEDES